MAKESFYQNKWFLINAYCVLGTVLSSMWIISVLTTVLSVIHPPLKLRELSVREASCLVQSVEPGILTHLDQ